MRWQGPILGAFGATVILTAPAFAQEPVDQDFKAPDQVSLTNANPGGSPTKSPNKTRLTSDSLLLGPTTPRIEDLRNAIKADVARNPRLAETYGDLLNPDQAFQITEDNQGHRTIFYMTPDGRGRVIAPN